MGRPRIHNKGLPARVYLSHGSYFFRPKAGRTVNLGRDFAHAMAEYGRLMNGAWAVLLRCWDMPAATRRAGCIGEVAKLWSR